jgi:2-amino-4-hydroxy-6-hydroxymethyldihydropteridine diphosphokinase
MTRCLLALGSNLGDRGAQLAFACRRLAQLPKTTLLARSGWYATPPVGGPEGQGEFLNAAALVETQLRPSDLLSALMAIEAECGRQRKLRWEARVLDLDLLLCDGLVVEGGKVEVPHPRMTYRRFVLEPAVEIAPAMVHPGVGWTLASLLGRLNVARPKVALISAAPERAVSLAEGLAARMPDHIRLLSPHAGIFPPDQKLLQGIELLLDAQAATDAVDLGGAEWSLTITVDSLAESLPWRGLIANLCPGDPACQLEQSLGVLCSAWPELLPIAKSVL